jgi:subtilase family serine protease
VPRARYAWMVSAVAAMALAASGVNAAAASTQSRVVLSGTAYQSIFGLIDKGAVATSMTVTDNIYLPVRDPDALAAEAHAVSTPGTRAYGKYISAGQVKDENQLAPAQVALVRDWLSAAGLTVSQPNWRSLAVAGTIGQLERAFDVTYDSYYVPADEGATHYFLMPTTDMSVPGDLGKLVLGVGTFIFRRPLASAGSEAPAKSDSTDGSASTADASVNLPAKFGGVTYLHTEGSRSSASATCSKYWDQVKDTSVPRVNGAAPPYGGCGYTPGQLRRAYGLDSSKLTGRGQTVAVVTPAMDTLQQDVDTWSKNVGVAPLRRGQLTVVSTPDGSATLKPNGIGYIGMVENTLDVEAVHGIAPDANVVSVGLSTKEGGTVLDSMAYILDHTHATIVSMSLGTGFTGDMRQAYDQAYQEGALQGVGFYVATGDGAPNPFTGSFLGDLAGTSWDTAVGGTALAIGKNGSREWETGWGDEVNALSSDGTSWQQPAQSAGGAGGGWVTGEPQPWYQRGVVSASLAKGPDGKEDRVGPDISMDADLVTGFLVGGTPLDGSPTTDPSTWHYIQQDIGGTSLATPLFAGVQALAQQASGKAFGFANPVIYQRANTPAIRDVTKYTLPDGAAPSAVLFDSVFGPGAALTTMLGRMYPLTPNEPLLPSTGPGFDTETGIGTPTGAYLRSFSRS